MDIRSVITLVEITDERYITVADIVDENAYGIDRDRKEDAAEYLLVEIQRGAKSLTKADVKFDGMLFTFSENVVSDEFKKALYYMVMYIAERFDYRFYMVENLFD